MLKVKLYFIVLILFISGCAVKYVADYDEKVFQEIILTTKKVDIFFATILETPVNKRGYDEFKDKYLSIEADLNSLLTRNQIRDLNEESIKQVKIVIELWLGDKAKHMKKNTFKNFIAKKHREQYRRILVAMAKAELAKKMK
ncbi:MAG: hypothetical protein GY714_15085 [Desulfobacterales bacterium]|nr:hypothetical protein [Desulfobacterales bacterium]